MGMASMGDRYRRPDWVRRMNAMGPAAGSARALVPLEAGAMIDAARTSTGVDEPGDLGDGDWEGRLRALAAAVDGGDLHVVGRLMTREELHARAAHPLPPRRRSGGATRRWPTR